MNFNTEEYILVSILAISIVVVILCLTINLILKLKKNKKILQNKDNLIFNNKYIKFKKANLVTSIVFLIIICITSVLLIIGLI